MPPAGKLARVSSLERHRGDIAVAAAAAGEPDQRHDSAPALKLLPKPRLTRPRPRRSGWTRRRWVPVIGPRIEPLSLSHEMRARCIRRARPEAPGGADAADLHPLQRERIPGAGARRRKFLAPVGSARPREGPGAAVRSLLLGRRLLSSVERQRPRSSSASGNRVPGSRGSPAPSRVMSRATAGECDAPWLGSACQQRAAVGLRAVEREAGHCVGAEL
jgi:hypothetical protein